MDHFKNNSLLHNPFFLFLFQVWYNYDPLNKTIMRFKRIIERRKESLEFLILSTSKIHSTKIEFKNRFTIKGK